MPPLRECAAICSSQLDLVGVDQASGAETFQNFRKARCCQSEAPFAAAENAVRARHLRTHIPGAMHDNRAGARIVIAGIQSRQPDRPAVPADIDAVRAVRARRCRVRSRRIRKALEPAGMPGIRAPSVRDQIRARAAAREIDNVKSRATRCRSSAASARRMRPGATPVPAIAFREGSVAAKANPAPDTSKERLQTFTASGLLQSYLLMGWLAPQRASDVLHE